MILILSVAVFLAWVTMVAAGDIRYRRIPNSLVVAGLICGMVSTISRYNPFCITPVEAVIGAVIGFVGLFPFFACRLMGAADVKVFTVLGLWCGFQGLFWCWIAASLAALIHVLGMMYWTRTPIGALWQRGSPTLALGARRGSPYAAFLVIAAAAWLIYLIVTGNLR
ncbi:A24 family peptidase [Burkholderia glumae]|uniref:A24 family peptidase n=1 Tax=Burkholderia glumae TaxID=337 RepID=UPI001464A689|nr:A24 family peptidase [Burkholderia glumae]QJP71510.1 prepilin peptidase [Burkholderia glumae]